MVSGMTIRVAMLLFVVSFAAITGWLVARKPAGSGIAQTPPAPNIAERAGRDAAPRENSAPMADVVAISNEEQDLKHTLHSVTIPRIDIHDETLEDALALVGLRLRELESTRLSSLHFIVRHPPRHGADLVGDGGIDTPPAAALDTPKVTLTAEDISVAAAITSICAQTGHLWGIEDSTLVLYPQE